MPGHVYVDETKRRGYLLAAAVLMPSGQDTVRRTLTSLVLPGQHRLHMNSERDSRRRQIVSAIVGSGVQATIYDAGRRYRTERDARAACLRAIVHDAASGGHDLLVLETDESLVSFDRRTLYFAAREEGCDQMLRYEHRSAGSEHLLCIPDAIAWCWANGGDWKRRITPAVAGVRTL